MSRLLDNLSDHSLVEKTDEEDFSNPFPVDAIPDDMRIFSEEVCRLEQVSHELVIPQVLGLIGALAGRSVEIQGIGDGSLRLNTFTITSARSGVGKSRVMKRLNKAVVAFEKEIQEKRAREIVPEAKARLKEIQEKYPDDIVMPKDAFEEKNKLLKQTRQPKLFVEDITSERVIERLFYNDETILVSSSDGRKPINNILGEYRKKGTDESIYLKGYSGDPHDTERKDKDTNMRLDSPCISIVLLVQPDKVEDLFRSKELWDSGFLARCFYINIDLEPAYIDLNPLVPDESILEIAEGKLINIGRQFYQNTDSVTIQFEDDAYRAFVKYHNVGVSDRRTGGKNADIAEFASRWPEGHLKLIGQIHLWKYGERSKEVKVTANDVLNAQKILEWFNAQQMTFLDEYKFKKGEQRKEKLLFFLKERGGSTDRSSILRGIRGLKSAELCSILKESSNTFQSEWQQIEGKKRVREIITLIKK